MALVEPTSSTVARLRRAAVVVACVIPLAACGGDGQATRDEQAARESGSPEPTSTVASPAGSVTIGSDVFVSREDGSASNETILLSGVFDREVAVTALRRAGDRFMLVDEAGTEYPDEASREEGTLYGADELYTPNDVADPRVLDNGIELYVDCKGVISPPMAATFRRVLREELDRAGITDAVVRNRPAEA